MARTISIGAQGFEELRRNDYFLVDKTSFLADWWHSGDVVTLICRPRRFGKTLNLDMTDCFFSTRHAGQPELFEGLSVWEDPTMRGEQGVWPTIFLSLADTKAATFAGMRTKIGALVSEAYRTAELPVDSLAPDETSLVRRTLAGELTDAELSLAIKRLCELQWHLTGRDTIVLLDEYDTPLQESWLQGYWNEASQLMRELLNSTFKTNPHLKRGLMTGITRVAHESIFSDLNNLKVVTSSSDEYAHSFGFSQAEVDAALQEFGLAEERERVRHWYDGFTFGAATDVYNPWSITNFLETRRLAPYWANTSGNSLVSSLVSSSDADFKSDFEALLSGGSVTETVSEQIVFPELESDPFSVWSLLVAGGYLRSVPVGNPGEELFNLTITNHETMLAFDGMVNRWFARARVPYNRFVKALLLGDVDAMNDYMNDVALDTFSTFDTGRRPSGSDPERFYHGFVLGLLVDLRGRYLIKSNRESGFGRYDVMLVPCDTRHDDGIVIEFKVLNPRREKSLEDTVVAAHAQIASRDYAASLRELGLPDGRIHAYGFAFEGKRVLIG